MKSQRYVLAVWLAAILFQATPAHAQGKAEAFPTRPVRMVVPFAPGGASDFVARIIQPRMTELLGQQVVVENRDGAAGNIGVEVAARATPNGYTFLLGNVGTMAINANILVSFPVKPLRDLASITQLVDVPGCLVVHPSLPVKNVKDFVAYLIANPGKLNFGSPGPGSANRLEMEMFRIAAGAQMTHVPYKGGAGPAMIGLLGNEVQTMFVTITSAVNFAKQGRVRMLGVVAAERNPAMPEVPTMREQGFDMVVGSWQGLFAPKGTPRNVINRLFGVGQETMRHPEVARKLGDSGAVVVLSKSPEDFALFQKKEHDRFARAVKAANVETQ